MKPEQILEMLGVAAVLLPICKRSKKHYGKGRKGLTFADTQTIEYQRKLNSHGNTGVLVGPQSENLCSIDFDDNKALLEFLEVNPVLKNTLRTVGNRGANLWVIVDGDYPEKVEHLKDERGEPVGEWRGGNGNYTLIAGIHPSNLPYRILLETRPIRIRFKDIDWSGISPFGGGAYIDDVDDAEDTNDAEDADDREYLDYGEEVGGEEREKDYDTNLLTLIQNAEKSEKQLRVNSHLWPLYDRYLLKKFTPKQGERYSQLEKMVPFLFMAVREGSVLPLVMAYYDTNQDVFADLREQHEGEAIDLLRGSKETWARGLNSREASMHSQLGEVSVSHQDVFRICRELSKHHEGKPFHLSCAELGKRVGLTSPKAQRVLQHLERFKVITMVEKGTQHRKGKKGNSGRGKATTYRWML